MAINMSYCRHENTAKAMEEVINEWDDFDEDNESHYEREGRNAIIELSRKILQMEGEI